MDKYVRTLIHKPHTYHAHTNVFNYGAHTCNYSVFYVRVWVAQAYINYKTWCCKLELPNNYFPDWRMNYRKVNWLENVRGVAKAIGSILKHSTSLTCRCQVFMSRETEVGSVVNFSVQGLLYQFQYPPQEIPHNYHYMLHDSGTLPIRVPPGKLCFTLELKEYLIPDKKDEVRFQKAERLTHYYSAQPNFDIDLNKKSKTRLKEGAVIANFSVSNDDGLVYECDLIKVSTF